jgi:hypothetical protein
MWISTSVDLKDLTSHEVSSCIHFSLICILVLMCWCNYNWAVSACCTFWFQHFKKCVHTPQGINLKILRSAPHSVFMCFVWIWEQTAIISLYGINWVVLRTFAKVRQATINLGIPVRLCAWNNTVPTGWIFMKFAISVFFENLSRKLKFH